MKMFKYKKGKAVLNWHGCQFKGMIISRDVRRNENGNLEPVYEFTTLNNIGSKHGVLNLHWKFAEECFEKGVLENVESQGS
jgi:hypothetical protein